MKGEDGMQPPELPFCACGCGGRVTKPGNKYIHGHNSKSNHPMKDKHQSEETKQKIKQTQKINKEIKEGKRPAPELPFCKCGCGGRVTNPNNEYINGHNKSFLGKHHTEESKQKNRESNLGKPSAFKDKHHTDEAKQKIRETHLGKKHTEEHNQKIGKSVSGEKNGMKGKHHTDASRQKMCNNHADVSGKNNPMYGKIGEAAPMYGIPSPMKGKHHTEESKQLIRDNTSYLCGEDHPMYGKHHSKESKERRRKTLKEKHANGEIKIWNVGLTKETDERVNEQAEKQSITQKEYYATEEGQGWLDRNLRGENSNFYGRRSWCYGLTKESSDGLKVISKKMIKRWKDPEFVKELINSWHRGGKGQTRPEKDIDSIVQIVIPKEYKFNGNFELGITIGGKIPDFVNVNGKKKAIDLFGDYWHDGEDPQVRIDLFKKYGWDLLVIWEHELKDRDAVIKKILKFHGIESNYVIPQKTLEKWIDSKDNIIKGGDKN